jgi:hypothetical protein
VDDSERLIARAALGEPHEAVAAWAEFKETNDLREASDLLTWAGGYIHRNLEGANRSDPYLAGIARHNWMQNNLILSRAHSVLTELTSRWSIVPLKSFGLGSATNERRLRPLADIDLYIDQRDLPGARALLETHGFMPLLSPSPIEFEGRILPQRGSWNFRDASGLDLDLHWKIFDHLTVAENRKVVASFSSPSRASYGPIRELDPALMTLLLCTQQQTQAIYTLSGLFDIDNLVTTLALPAFVSLAKKVNAEHAARQALTAISTLTSDVSPAIEAALGLLPDNLPDTETTKAVRRFFSSSNLETPNAAVVRNVHLYRVWWALGHFARTERVLLRLFGAFSRGSIRINGDTESTIHFSEQDALGPGWHYNYPGNTYRWANRPDTRFALTVAPGPALTATISVDEKMWELVPIDRMGFYLEGVRLATLTKGMDHVSFIIPPREQEKKMEISCRPDVQVTFPHSGVHSNWHGFSAPFTTLQSTVG